MIMDVEAIICRITLGPVRGLDVPRRTDGNMDGAVWVFAGLAVTGVCYMM